MASKEEHKDNTKSKTSHSHHSKHSHSKSHSKHPDNEPTEKKEATVESRIDPPNLTNWNKQPATRSCITHSQPLKYYCDNCEEPICYECTTQGPHNSQMHRAITLEEAFNSRFSILQNSMSSSISKKREKVLVQMQKITQRTEEIKKVKTIIERDIRCEYSGILERLRSAEGVKLAVLSHDMCELQNDLDKIDAILNHMSIVSKEKDQVKFLSVYVRLNEDIESILTKPIRADITVNPLDFPRELTERRKILDDSAGTTKQSRFKDDIIWKLLCERKEDECIGIKKVEDETRKELDEWAKLTDKFANELAKFDVACVFCGAKLDPSNVNGTCESVKENMGQNIPKGIIEKRMHYFKK